MYKFIVNNQEFKLSVKWDAENKKLKWESAYIDSHIGEWHDKIKNEKNNHEARRIIIKTIKDEFSGYFPIMTLFLPATRAIASIIDKDKVGNNVNNNIVLDKFFREFIPNTKFLDSLAKSDEAFSEINDILRPYKIYLSKEKISKSQKTEFIFRTAGSNRIISLLEMSSGQQEVIYLLTLIINLKLFFYMRYMGEISIFSSNNLSLFIEEPSTHPFPRNKKQLLSFL